MKVRIRFSKEGSTKFVGHLDMVRYFQKVMRRANVDVAYSEGFSPHQKMSFASPLSVGVESSGEYFDMEINSSDASDVMISRINSQNAEGIKVLSYKLLPDDAKNAMSVLIAADYQIITTDFDESDLISFINQPEIIVLKKTKKSEKEINIKPMIHELKIMKDGIFIKLDHGSSSNLKPELVVDALYNFTGKQTTRMPAYKRLDMYQIQDECMVSLDSIGGIIE